MGVFLYSNQKIDKTNDHLSDLKNKVTVIIIGHRLQTLKNADELIQKIKSGEVQYDFVEVMACRRGCMAGGGQPVPIGARTKAARYEGLYRIDDASQIKRSNDNPIVGELYEGLLKGKEHKLLHNNSDLPQAK